MCYFKSTRQSATCYTKMTIYILQKTIPLPFIIKVTYTLCISDVKVKYSFTFQPPLTRLNALNVYYC